MLNEFSNWLNQYSGTRPALAWCHSTGAYGLKKMIADGEFRPRPCSVFKEDLTYFFYGRPAYKSTGSGTDGQSGSAPVALILKPEIISFAKRVFPFDSGAFENSRYAQWILPDMKKEDFEITKLDDSPCKHVEAFFGTNVSYFDCTGVPRHDRFDVFEVDAIASMVSDIGSRGADDRRIAVEMQVANALPFTNEHIHAIVGPTAMMAAPWLTDFLAGPGTGIKCVTYSWNHLKESLEYQALLEDKTRSILIDMGLL